MNCPELLSSRALMRASHSGTFIWDVHSGLVFGNSNLAGMFELREGFVRRGIPLEYLIDRIHPGDRSGIFKAMTTSLQQCGFYWAQFRIERGASLLHVQAFGRCQSEPQTGDKYLSGAVFDLTGFLPDRELSQEQADLEQMFHNFEIAKTLAMRNGYTDTVQAVQILIDDLDRRAIELREPDGTTRPLRT